MTWTPERHQAAKQRCENATQGPWIASHRDSLSTEHDDEVGGLGLEIEGPPEAMNRGQFELSADARFIANARQDLPDALAEIERLQAALQLAHTVMSAFDALQNAKHPAVRLERMNDLDAALDKYFANHVKQETHS